MSGKTSLAKTTAIKRVVFKKPQQYAYHNFYRIAKMETKNAW